MLGKVKSVAPRRMQLGTTLLGRQQFVSLRFSKSMKYIFSPALHWLANVIPFSSLRRCIFATISSL